MLLQFQIIVLNKKSCLMKFMHLDVSPCQPCWLFQMALHTVFQEVCFKPLLLKWRSCVLDFLIWACQPVHTALCPLPPSAQTPLRSALCFTDYCQHFVPDDSNKGFFGGVNKRQLTLLSFPTEASTRQKLTAFLFLVDLFRVNLFTP